MPSLAPTKDISGPNAVPQQPGQQVPQQAQASQYMPAPATNAPNFGTGAVDWGTYVGANQGTINRDRAQVQGYLAGQPGLGTAPPAPTVDPTKLGQGLGSIFGQTPAAATPPSSYAAPAASPDWASMNAALATPQGFEQDLGAANYPSLMRRPRAAEMSIIAESVAPDAATVAPVLRDVVRKLDPDMPVFDVRTM